MIPCRLTGKPFWDLYLYNAPPPWEAYITAAKHFQIDALMDGYCPLVFDDETDPLVRTSEKPISLPGEYEYIPDEEWTRYIVFKNEGRIVTQRSRKLNGSTIWEPKVNVYYVADSPTEGVPPAKIGLPDVPENPIPLEGVKPVDLGPNIIKHLKELMGDQGIIGAFLVKSLALHSEADIYKYYDHPEMHEQWAAERVEAVEKRFAKIMAMPVKPDFLCCGSSGTLVFQTVDLFRQITFPAVKRGIELATAAGIPTHIHSCGPEKELIKIMAEETTLSVIDPLEIPPMGDCILADMKKFYGDKITLKGNLHTTEVMLHGTVDEVIAASKKAIDDAAEGGRFILSTGDQCGRDTPDENLKAMVETARTYGKY